MKLWSAQSVSLLGTQVTSFALPMVAIVWLHATPFQIGALGMLQTLPFALIGLPTGAWVDRRPRRPILMAGDLGRAAFLLTIPVGWLLGHLWLGQLYLVAFGNGVLTVFFDLAYAAYLPSLVDRSRLLDGHSRMELSRSGAQLTGPLLAVELIHMVQAPGAIVADSLSFVGSALFVSRIRTNEQLASRASMSHRRMREDVREGLRYVLRHELLLPIALSTSLITLSTAMTAAVYMIYVLRVLGLRAGMLGVVLALGNVGFLLGALSTKRIARRLGTGKTIVAASATLGLPLLLLLMAPVGPRAIPFLIGGGAIASFSTVVYNTNQVSLRQSVTPPEMLARMTATIRSLVTGVMPIGSLLGGVLATAFGFRITLWITMAVASVAFVPVLASSHVTHRSDPMLAPWSGSPLPAIDLLGLSR